jgi:hypothetical protein
MYMRLTALVFTAILTATAAVAQEAQTSSPAQASSTRPDNNDDKHKPQEQSLPVSLDKIKKELEQPPPQLLRGTDDKPTFKLEVKEKSKISLDDLIKSLDYKAGPVPAGGVYAAELNRQVFNPTNYPFMQPYSAFSTGELVTILVENLVGKYLAGKASNAITGATRDHAVAAARAEVEQAIADYCAAQPNRGAGIQICASSPAIR